MFLSSKSMINSKMDPNFRCFIDFDGHNYDIIINEDISSVCFEDIFQKIQQILKLALNEEIVFETHIFEVFDNNSSKGVLIQTFNGFIKHLSTIRINRNPAVSPPILVTPFNPYLQPTVGFTPLPFVPSIPTSSTSPTKASDDFIPHEYYCDVCPKSMDKIDPRLKKLKLNLNFESYKRFSDLMTTIKEMSQSNCDAITDNQWLNDIPYKMSSFGHKDLPKLWKNSFEIFLKKYVEAMEVSPNRYVACSLFPFFHEYNAFRFNESDPNYQKITDLRQKMRSPSVEKLPEMSKKEKKTFRKLIAKLMDEEEDIKVFHLIVQLVDESECIYKKRAKKKWERVSAILSRYGYSSRIYSASSCRERFFSWASWYAQNYSKLNEYLEPNEERVFDLLRIVHILDFNKFWSYNNSTHSLLRKLSHKREIRKYLKDSENRKLELKKVNQKEKSDSNKSSLKSDKIVDKDFSPKLWKNSFEVCVDMNLEVNQPVIESRPDVGPLTSSSESGEKSKTVVSPSDSRAERLKRLIYWSSGDRLNPIVIDSEEDEVVEQMPIDVKPVIDANGSVVQTSAQENPIQKTIPLTDPRLRRKMADKSDANIDSTNVIPVQTAQSVESSKSPNESISSEAVSLSKPSFACNVDPRLNRKSHLTPKAEPTPPNTQIKETVIKSEPIVNYVSNPSAQPFSSIRDPRLKRKLEQQSEQSVESSGQTCLQNTNKKFKSETIQIV